jgi:octaprenyl-diphosphate synthase
MFVADTTAAAVPAAELPQPKPPSPWKQIVAPVEPFLRAVSAALSEQVEAFDSEIAVYARYALTNQGKQLRPSLVGLSAGATGKVRESLVTIAVIIEMVHLATLVHDDIMDEAVLRRRRPTLAANWGNQVSVLVGDCLFAHALKLAASFPTPEVCRAVSAATNTVCAGEILQTNRRHNCQITRAEYFRILEMKTAELFALSCELGAWSNGASATRRQALRRYGLALGTAYQIYDDCLDLFGSESLVGKSLGTDLAGGKVTLPLLVALERAEGADRQDLEAAIQQWEPRSLPRVLALLERYDALDASRQVIDQHLQDARSQLAVLPDSEGRRGLTRLTEFLAQQSQALGVHCRVASAPC